MMLSRLLSKFAVFFSFILVCEPVSAEDETVEIYIDADYSISVEAAHSIELGIKAALSSAGNSLGGLAVEVIAKDHRGNVKRAKRTLDEYLASDNALAVFGGLHSPPYLAHREFINTNSILTLLPWSAAGPITRSTPGHQNWIFRLSVDDTKSGDFFVEQTVDHGECRKLALLLLETGWGRANSTTLKGALNARSMAPVLLEFFPTTLGPASAKSLADKVSAAGADCAIMLSNWHDGAILANAIHDLAPGVRLFSHWGIMGGRFANEVSPDVRNALELSVLQTCGLQKEAENSIVLKNALARAHSAPSRLSEVPAPAGFVHGYDLTLLLIAAAQQAEKDSNWKDASIGDRRRLIHAALENLNTSVDGILRRYEQPFSPFSPDRPDAHEALGKNDLCIARFHKDGHLEDAR